MGSNGANRFHGFNPPQKSSKIFLTAAQTRTVVSRRKMEKPPLDKDGREENKEPDEKAC
jgi:hypothetical protein